MIWLVAAVLMVSRGGVAAVPLPDVVLDVGAWVLVVLSVLGAIVNLASSSPLERFGWAPFSAVLALLSFIVASSPSWVEIAVSRTAVPIATFRRSEST